MFYVRTGNGVIPMVTAIPAHTRQAGEQSSCMEEHQRSPGQVYCCHTPMTQAPPIEQQVRCRLIATHTHTGQSCVCTLQQPGGGSKECVTLTLLTPRCHQDSVTAVRRVSGTVQGDSEDKKNNNITLTASTL